MNLYQRYDGVLFVSDFPVKYDKPSVYLMYNLETGSFEIIDSISCTEPAPNDHTNVTGQKLILEKISGVVNDLSKVSTESLLEELKKRRDNPFSSVMLNGDEDNVFLREYQAGYYETYLRYDNNKEDIKFTPVRTFDNYEEATLYSQFHEFRGHPLSVIMHLVIKMEPDIGI